jgi:hypothetical protein
MEYIETEQQMQKFMQSLIGELKQAKAVDENGRATDVKAFESILDKKIKELENMDNSVTDEAGVARDRYSANKFMKTLETLREIRNHHAVKFDVNAYSLKQGAEKEEQLLKTDLRNKFIEGIRKIMARFSMHRNNQKANESR